MLPVSNDMIAYLAQKASQVLRCEDDTMQSNQKLPLTPPESPIPDAHEVMYQPRLPSVASFIRSLVRRSHVEVPTLMTSLVFLARLRAKLPPMSKGMRCTPHRIFLASLILAAKNINDSSPKNKHWSRYTFVDSYNGFGFSLPEVNLMERQLLALLNWDTRVREEDLFEHFEPFLAPIRERLMLQDKLQAARETEWKLQASLLPHSPSLSRSVSPLPPPPPPRNHLPSVGVYDSPPRSLSNHPNFSILRHKRRQSSLGSGGGRSLSPPSIRDVPYLSYEGGSSSRSSSITPSSRGTPASISTLSTAEILLDDAGKHSPSSMMSSYVSVQQLKQPKTKTHGYSEVHHLPLLSFQKHPQQQSLKRAKVAGAGANGNVFSRFFGSAEKRMNRAAARG